MKYRGTTPTSTHSGEKAQLQNLPRDTVIDARVLFAMSRTAAIAKRENVIDLEATERDLRKVMRDGWIENVRGDIELEFDVKIGPEYRGANAATIAPTPKGQR